MNWGYKGTVADFLDTSESSLLGFLSQSAANSGFLEHKHDQTHAWLEEIRILKFYKLLIRDRPESSNLTLTARKNTHSPSRVQGYPALTS